MSDTAQQQQQQPAVPTIDVVPKDDGTAVVTFKDTPVGDRRPGRDRDEEFHEDTTTGGSGGESVETRRSRSALRRERQRNTRAERENRIAALEGVVGHQNRMLQVIALGHQENALATLDRELADAAAAHAEAARRHAKAVSEGDGAAAAEAVNVGNRAASYHATVLAQRNQLASQIQANRGAMAEQDKTAQAQPTGQPRTAKAEALKNAFLDRNPWIDPDGTDDVSALVRTIDARVAADGHKANTEDYWNELEDRLREALPHKFGKQTRRRDQEDDEGEDMTDTTQRRTRQPQLADDDDYEDERPARRRGGPPLGGGRDNGDDNGRPQQLQLDAAQLEGLRAVGIPLVGGTPDQQRRRAKMFEQWRSTPRPSAQRR